jgi:hypothetical protein
LTKWITEPIGSDETRSEKIYKENGQNFLELQKERDTKMFDKKDRERNKNKIPELIQINLEKKGTEKNNLLFKKRKKKKRS